MIKNIIFDLVNVVVNSNREYIISNFTNKEEEIKYINEEIFKAPEWELMDLGEITNDEATERINKRNEYKYEKLTTDFLHKWYKLREINKEVTKITRELKDKGYKIFVLSNMAKPSYEYFKEDEFFSLCTGIVISAHEHLIKPDERIFKLILDRYNLNAEECLFIDDREVNSKSANKIGIHGRSVIPNDVEDIKKLLLEYKI